MIKGKSCTCVQLNWIKDLTQYKKRVRVSDAEERTTGSVHQ